MAENGSEIKPVVFNKIDDEKEKTFIFLTATDTETIVKPQIFRRFTNISKYTQKNVKVTMFANANAMTTVGRRSLEALRLQPLGKPPQCFS